MTKLRFFCQFLVPVAAVCGMAAAGLAIAASDAPAQRAEPDQHLVLADAGVIRNILGESHLTAPSARQVGTVASLSTRMGTAVDDVRRTVHALAVATAVGSETARGDALLEAELTNVPEALREPSAAALLAAGFVSMLVIVRQRLKR